jgi:hypothetical protein
MSTPQRKHQSDDELINELLKAQSIAVLTRTKYNIPFSEKRKYNESLFN